MGKAPIKVMGINDIFKNGKYSGLPFKEVVNEDSTYITFLIEALGTLELSNEAYIFYTEKVKEQEQLKN